VTFRDTDFSGDAAGPAAPWFAGVLVEMRQVKYHRGEFPRTRLGCLICLFASSGEGPQHAFANIGCRRHVGVVARFCDGLGTTFV